MVSSEEIRRRLELKRNGLSIDKEFDRGMERICSKCQTSNLKNSKFCIGCGYDLNKTSKSTTEMSEAGQITCSSCGSKNKPNSKFCIGCGNELNKINANKPDEVKLDPIICPDCNLENNLSSKFCIGCGTNLKILSNGIMEDQNPIGAEIHEEEVQLDIKSVNALDKEVNNGLDMENGDISGEGDINSESDKEINILDEIKKAKELLDMGAISEGEYEKIKTKYLELLN